MTASRTCAVRLLLSLLGLVPFVIVGCLDIGDRHGDGDGDVDVDTDADGDGDYDSDTDEPDETPPAGSLRTDWNADTALDIMGGEDTGLLGCPAAATDRMVPETAGGLDPSGAPVCSNGVDDDGDLLCGCGDPGCRLDPVACCVEPAEPIIDGDFSECGDGLEACGWQPFAASARDVVATDGEWLVLGGDGLGEAGAYASRAIALTGGPILSAIVSLEAPTCESGTCPQAVGLAFSDQQIVSGGTGVVPFAGIVIDGESEAVHLYVLGELLHSEDVAASSLTEPRGYAIRVGLDGRVSFWVGLEATDGEGVDVEETEPTWRADVVVDPDQVGARAVVFGRLSGARAAVVRSVEVARLVCDSPRDWLRAAEAAVLNVPVGGAARPSVIARPSAGGYLMAFENGDEIALATSLDGVEWERAGEALPLALEDMVVARSPALLYLAGDTTGEPYRMWVEAHLEDGSTSIVAYSSADGIQWQPLDPPRAVDSREDPDWLNEVSDPAVVLIQSETVWLLRLWFVGRDSRTGASAIGYAISSDGKTWDVGGTPIELDPMDGGAGGGIGGTAFDWDGVAEPTVVEREGVLQMWYVGLSGSRSVVVHAVSSIASGGLWQSYGPVFEPTAGWEEMRIGGPAVLLEEGGDGRAALRLWYDAGAIGQERIGLATRDLPAVGSGAGRGLRRPWE